MSIDKLTPRQLGATASERNPLGALPWIILTLWLAWLGAMAAMSIPEWGKSKRNLIETKDARPAQ